MRPNLAKLSNAQEVKSSLKKKFTDVAMSKPVGKVLDSKPGKVGVGIGNALIKASTGIAKSGGKALSAPFKWAGGKIANEMKMNKAKDDEYQRQGEDMRQGRQQYLPSNVKIRK